jgi:transcription elongation factor GreA
MEKVPMTAGGYQTLDEELKRLKTIERPAVIAAISEARQHGDLSENAEYHAAKERQGWIEGRSPRSRTRSRAPRSSTSRNCRAPR